MPFFFFFFLMNKVNQYSCVINTKKPFTFYVSSWCNGSWLLHMRFNIHARACLRRHVGFYFILFLT